MIDVSRRNIGRKKEADRIASMMRRVGMDQVRIIGHRNSWSVLANASVSELAKFASDEARAAMELEKKTYFKVNRDVR